VLITRDIPSLTDLSPPVQQQGIQSHPLRHSYFLVLRVAEPPHTLQNNVSGCCVRLAHRAKSERGSNPAPLQKPQKVRHPHLQKDDANRVLCGRLTANWLRDGLYGKAGTMTATATRRQRRRCRPHAKGACPGCDAPGKGRRYDGNGQCRCNGKCNSTKSTPTVFAGTWNGRA
jgi:hypothetical protein